MSTISFDERDGSPCKLVHDQMGHPVVLRYRRRHHTNSPIDAIKRFERTALRFRLVATAASTAAFPTTVTADVTPARPASHGLEANASIACMRPSVKYSGFSIMFWEVCWPMGR